MQLFENKMHTNSISIYSIEALNLLTDDIIEILRTRAMFYADNGSQIYFETAQEYQKAMLSESNFILENVIHDTKYICNGIFSISAQEFIRRELLPLKNKIISLYRYGTGADTYFVVDSRMSDTYLMEFFAVRVIDLIVQNAKMMTTLNSKLTERFLLAVEDEDYVEKEKLGIFISKEELLTTYHAYKKYMKEENDERKLTIYKFTRSYYPERDSLFQDCEEIKITDL